MNTGDVELTDRTLVALMAAIIYTKYSEAYRDRYKECVESAKKLLSIVETGKQ